MDSIYTRDAAVVCNRGVILCNMGKRARESEPAAQGAFYREQGIRVLGSIRGTGSLEGGDLLWLDEKTVAVGISYRTNREGVRQLRSLLPDQEVQIIEVPLPHWLGPEDVFPSDVHYQPAGQGSCCGVFSLDAGDLQAITARAWDTAHRNIGSGI